MNLKQLEYIIEVSRCGSLHKAAENLYISQPSLSIAVKNLEDELGFSIFRRTRKGVELTINGEKIVQEAMQILDITRNWKNLSDKETVPKTKVYINTQGILANTLVPSLMESCNVLFPDIHIYFNELIEIPQVKKEDTTDPTINLFFCEKEKYAEYAQIAANNGYTAKIIDEGKSYIFMNSQNMLTSKPKITLQDLNGLTNAEFQSTLLSFYPYADLFEKLDKEKQIHMPNREAILEIISKNKDVISQFSYVVAATNQYVKQGVIKAVEISDFPMPTLLAAIYKTNSDDTVLKLLELIQKAAEGLRYHGE